MGASSEKFSLMEKGGSRGRTRVAPAGRGSLPRRTMEIPFLSRLLHGAGEGVSEWVCGLAEAKIPIFHLRIFPSWHSREWNGPQHCPGLGFREFPKDGEPGRGGRGAELNPGQPRGRQKRGF